MKNCLDCPKHAIINDPDPHDWFCSDDVAVVCQGTLNQARDTQSKYMADHSEYRPVTVSCRPYNTRNESNTPDWCPLNKKE